MLQKKTKLPIIICFLAMLLSIGFCQIGLAVETPTICIGSAEGSVSDTLDNTIRVLFNLPDTTAVTCWDTGRLDMMQNNVIILGYLLDKREEAEQFCNFYQEYIDEMIGERLSKISESDRQRVYLEHLGDYMAFTVGSSGHELCVAAGGINIAADLPDIPEKPIVKVDQEWLIEENPDVIVKMMYCSKSGLCGYC